MTFLLRYYKAIAVAAAVGLLLYAISSVIDRAEQRGYQRATSEIAAEVRKRDADTADREAEERELSRQTDIHYQQVTRDLQSRIDTLTARNVDLGRLRNCAATRRDTPTGAAVTAAVTDGGAGQGGHDLPARGDLGRELVRYAGECERFRRQLSELQAWLRASG